MSVGIVYLARCKANGKTYVGQTIGTLERRRRQHENAAGRTGKPFQNALKKYGLDSFEWSVLEVVTTTQSDLNKAELNWGLKLNAFVDQGGYSLDLGFSGGRQSSVSRQNKSISMSAYYARSGTKKKNEDNRSEVRLHKSEAAKKLWEDPVFREKMSKIRREVWARRKMEGK